MRASSSAPESQRRKLASLVDFCRVYGMAILFNEVMLAYGRSFFFYVALCEAVYDGSKPTVCNEIPSELCWMICLGLSTVVNALRRISATVFFASLLSGSGAWLCSESTVLVSTAITLVRPLQSRLQHLHDALPSAFTQSCRYRYPSVMICFFSFCDSVFSLVRYDV